MSSKQVWACSICGTRRIYGIGSPEHHIARIGCNGTCNKPTLHAFIQFATDTFGDAKYMHGPLNLMDAERRP